MVALTLSFFLLAASLCALSAPFPSPHAVSGSATATAPAAPVASASPAVPVNQAAAEPSQLDVTSPVTFGDLTTPSLGGTFNDFNAKNGTAAPKSRRRVSKVRQANSRAEVPDKRSLVPGLFGHHHKAFPIFEAEGAPPAKGANPAKSVAAAKGANPAKTVAAAKGANPAKAAAAGKPGNAAQAQSAPPAKQAQPAPPAGGDGQSGSKSDD